MNLLTRVELFWWMPTGDCVPARDLIGKEAELVQTYLAMRQPSIKGGLFIDVDDGPWSTEDNIDDLCFGVVWWRALTELLQDATVHKGYGPTYESVIKFERFDHDVVIEDVNMYGKQVMRAITVPLRELAEAVALEGPVFVALSRGIRRELEAERARTIKRKAEQFARIDYLVASLLTEEHDIPTIEGLTAALGPRARIARPDERG
jgi:hypothetical protein